MPAGAAAPLGAHLGAGREAGARAESLRRVQQLHGRI